MGKRIAVVGVGALGGYVGGNLAHAGRGRDADRFLAGEHRDHPQARAGARRRDAGGEVHGHQRQDHASHRDGGPVAPEADRHRLRVDEVLRHRMGDGADQAVPGARRLCRVAAELPERGAHRGRRRLGQDGRHGGLADLGRHVRGRPASAAPSPRAATSTPCSGSARSMAASPSGSRSCATWWAASTAPRPRPTCGASAGPSSARTA